MADQHHHRQTNHSPDDHIMYSSKYQLVQFQKRLFINFKRITFISVIVYVVISCYHQHSHRQTIPNIYNHRFQTPENRHLKTTKTIIIGIPLNINVLIKMLELAKAMERNIPVLLMWRRPYGCIYIAHLVHLLICNFFAFSQKFLGYWTFIFQEYISPQFQICERMQRDLSRITELLIPCSNF